mgnify:CR=1 FL=1
MTAARAHLHALRIAPRKVRLVVDSIRGLDVQRAQRVLAFQQKIASRSVLKLLRSAIANAKQNHHMDAERLFVKSITADGGPTLKRFRPRAFGASAPIRKRTTHITVILEERPKPAKEQTKPKEKAEQHAPAPQAPKATKSV